MRGLVSSLLEGRAGSIESDLASNERGWWTRLFGDMSESEKKIDQRSALTIDAVWICVTSIAADVAKLPLHAYRRIPNGREKALQLPAYPLLLNSPNPRMSALVFRDTLQGHALNWGNGFAEIERNGRGDPVGLWPMDPSRTYPQIKGGRLVYEYQKKQGGAVVLDQSDVFHLKGFGFDGLVGYSVIEMARRSLGGVWATQEYARRMFDNNATPGGLLTHPGKLNDPARKNLKESWERQHKGPEKAGGLAILDEGLKFEKMSFSPQDAQFIEKQQFDVPTVCRWYRFPPHKAMDLSRATFNNIEHISLDYLSETLLFWLLAWEQEAWMKLLTPEQQADHYFAHKVNALLRTDMKSRFESYGKGIQDGWLLPDEAREMEDMNPLPDGQGQIARFPTNMTTPAKALQAAPPGTNKLANPSDTPNDGARDRRDLARLHLAGIVEAIEPILDQSVRRLIRVESDKARAAAKRNDLGAWVGDFFGAEHLDHVREALFPSAETAARSACTLAGIGLSACDLPGMVRAIAEVHVSQSRDGLAKIQNRDLDGVLDGWEKTRAENEAKLIGEQVRAWLDKRLGKEAP